MPLVGNKHKTLTFNHSTEGLHHVSHEPPLLALCIAAQRTTIRRAVSKHVATRSPFLSVLRFSISDLVTLRPPLAMFTGDLLLRTVLRHKAMAANGATPSVKNRVASVGVVTNRLFRVGSSSGKFRGVYW